MLVSIMFIYILQENKKERLYILQID